MNSRSIYKVPGGKLLRISLDYDEKTNRIQQIKIMGDFFAYPEEAIETLEVMLKDTDIERGVLRNKIQSIINEYRIQFIGLDAEGLTQGIVMCIR